MRKTKPTNLEKKLSDAAILLIDAATKSPNLQDFTGAFKAAVGYYATINKVKPPVDDEDGKFGGHIETLSGAGGTGTRRGKARNGGASEEPEF